MKSRAKCNDEAQTTAGVGAQTDDAPAMLSLDSYLVAEVEGLVTFTWLLPFGLQKVLNLIM